MTHLSNHSSKDEDEHALGVGGLLETGDKALGLGAGRIGLLLVLVVDEALLGLGDVEEAVIGGVEEGDTQGQPGAHDPVLCVSGRDGPRHVAKLDRDPVHVEEEDGGEGEDDAADAQDGVVAAGVEKDASHEDEQRPDGHEDGVEDGHAILARLVFRVGREAQLGAHGGWRVGRGRFLGREHKLLRGRRRGKRKRVEAITDTTWERAGNAERSE